MESSSRGGGGSGTIGGGTRMWWACPRLGRTGGGGALHRVGVVRLGESTFRGVAEKGRLDSAG